MAARDDWLLAQHVTSLPPAPPRRVNEISRLTAGAAPSRTRDDFDGAGRSQFLCLPEMTLCQVLNLFLALLLSSFGASNLSAAPADSADTKKLAEAFDRFARAWRWVKNLIFSVLKQLRSKVTNQIGDQTPDLREDLEETPQSDIMADGQVLMKDKTELEVVVSDGLEIAFQAQCKPLSIFVTLPCVLEDGKALKMKIKNNKKPVMNSVRIDSKIEPQDNKDLEIYVNKVHPPVLPKDEDSQSNKSLEGNNKVIVQKPSKRNSSIISGSDDEEEKHDISKEEGENGSQEDIDRDKIETTTADVIISEYPADCCPDICYTKVPFCMGDESEGFWKFWKELRRKSFVLIEDKYFETLVITLILISSLALAAEDVNLKYRPLLKEILTYMDKVFTVIFFFEMLIKWLAMGFKKYFQNAWCWLDFVIVLVSIFNLAVGLMGFGNIPAFKTMRTLRALRPLRALSRLEGMRVSVINLIANSVGGARIQAFKTMRTLRALRPLRALSRFQGMRVSSCIPILWF
ncbi:para [Cordylochernes scorpioides]|uniref:Para n=1 Tax=Cordylochernes scorpioides TaxID=51811 RepID=A0ABY6L7G3_9ARAC|nr:para [Cordylochernes scorpioides]